MIPSLNNPLQFAQLTDHLQLIRLSFLPPRVILSLILPSFQSFLGIDYKKNLVAFLKEDEKLKKVACIIQATSPYRMFCTEFERLFF